MKRHLNFKHSDESLKKTIKNFQPYDIAVIYESLNDEEKNRLIKLMTLEQTVDVFVELEIDDQKEIFEILSNTVKKSLLRKLETDELKAFIEMYETHEERDLIVQMLSKVKAKTIQLLLTYDEDEAAYIMMTDFFTIDQDLTIKEATSLVVTKSKDNDYIDTVFIQDEHKKCIGHIDLQNLIIARSNQKLEELMVKDFPFVYTDDSIEEAIQYVLDYDKNVIPVLNKDHEILGIITADDIFDELIEDYEEEYESFSQISDHDISLSSFQRSKQRLPWLMIGVLLNLLTITILSRYAATIEQVTALILFQPMILGMAGNIGTQALAVTILGIHQSDFKENIDAKKHIISELLIGLTNSLLLGVIAFIFVQVYLTILNMTAQMPIDIAFTVFISLTTAMFISSILGSVVPLVFDRLNIDPASASGPLMTTINDIVSLVIYFSIATVMFL
ncbi:magnesium transporter [Mycoplasmatota bacterium]|nr:magnesium transporter [Mycoplasmatota bacterium]